MRLNVDLARRRVTTTLGSADDNRNAQSRVAGCLQRRKRTCSSASRTAVRTPVLRDGRSVFGSLSHRSGARADLPGPGRDTLLDEAALDPADQILGRTFLTRASGQDTAMSRAGSSMTPMKIGYHAVTSPFFFQRSAYVLGRAAKAACSTAPCDGASDAVLHDGVPNDNATSLDYDSPSHA